MPDAAMRERCEDVSARSLWQLIPLELVMSGLAILGAAALKLGGVLP